MTKEYDLIRLDSYTHAVEPFKERTDFPYICLEKDVNGEWFYWQVDGPNDWDSNTQVNIVASDNPLITSCPVLPTTKNIKKSFSEHEIEDIVIRVIREITLISQNFELAAYIRNYMKNRINRFEEINLASKIILNVDSDNPDVNGECKPMIAYENIVNVAEWIK